MAPRLRDDLVAATVDDDGVAYVDLTDPATGINFRFYDFEYALAKQLTGQPLEDVVAWASATYQIDLTSEALDQFIEKLAGLGFLAGAGAGAQPVSLSPLSPSPGSGPFGKLPGAMLNAGVLADGEPVELVSSPMFGDAGAPGEVFSELSSSALTETPAPPEPPPAPPATASATPAAPAAIPAALTEGEATEYRLKEAKSGLWAKGRTLHGINLAPLTPMTPLAPAPPALDSGPGPLAPQLPRMQVLAPPLPPLTSEAIASPSPRRQTTTAAPATPEPNAPESPPAGGETPLASIAHAIVAEASGAERRSTPLGALDAPAPPGAVRSEADEAPKNSASWAAALTDEVEKPTAERRQPPRPEVVVMPPVAGPAAPGSLPRPKAPLVVGVLLVAGIAIAAVFALRPEPRPLTTTTVAPPVHVVAPQPTTYYRWFAPSGAVVAGRDDELGFKTMGKVQDVMPPGTTFSAGEPVARLQGVAARELNVNRIRARVAFFEQLRDTSRAAGNEAAAKQAEANIAARTRELADAQAKLAEMEIRPPAAGQIGQVLVERGALVKPGTPVFRIRAAGPRATFALPTEEQAKARALGFCRLETVPGTGATDGGPAEKAARAVDCAFAGPVAGDNANLTVDLVGATEISPGTAVRLASARFDGVFPIPRAALVQVGVAGGGGHDGAANLPGDRVWIVAPSGETVESRAVEVAATVDELALIARGLVAGDAVVVDPPASLSNGGAVTVTR